MERLTNKSMPINIGNICLRLLKVLKSAWLAFKILQINYSDSVTFSKGLADFFMGRRQNALESALGGIH